MAYLRTRFAVLRNARLAPDAIAAQQDDAAITYGELDASNRLAHLLMERGVEQPLVGVLLDDATV